MHRSTRSERRGGRVTVENARVHGPSTLPPAVTTSGHADRADRARATVTGPRRFTCGCAFPVRDVRRTFTGPLRVSDASLAAAAPTNPTAFAAIYRRYGDALHDFCLGMLRDPDAAADCVQDVFCTAATRLGSYANTTSSGPGSTPSPATRPSPDCADADGNSRGGPARPAHRRARSRSAGRARRARRPGRRRGGRALRPRPAVLELHYRHGLDGPELADALGVSATNANTLVSRLRDTSNAASARCWSPATSTTLRRARRAPGRLGRRP